MPSDPSTIIDRQIEAYNRRDLDGFLACYRPDAVLFNMFTRVWSVRKE